MASEIRKLSAAQAQTLAAQARFVGDDPEHPGDKLYYKDSVKMWLRAAPLPTRQPSITLQSPGSLGCVFQPVRSLPLKSGVQPSESWAWPNEIKLANNESVKTATRRRMGCSEW